MSPKCDSLAQNVPEKFNGDVSDQKEKAKYSWKFRRNGVNERGERVGYGVITGEKEAEKYLSTGSFSVEEGDEVFILTDGFEDYFKLPEFISLFEDGSDLENKIKNFTKNKSEEDPWVYGHERSLISISV